MFKRLAATLRNVRCGIIVSAAMILVFCSAVAVVRLARDDVPVNSGNADAIRGQLLIGALDYVGTCDPASTASVWAEGLRMRSAAMQYAVMGADLRAEYAAQLEETFPNWVTGVSSPWVDSYDIMKAANWGDTKAAIELSFTTATSTGIADTYYATLTLEKQGAFWRVTDIDADEELAVYTGFVPGT